MTIPIRNCMDTQKSEQPTPVEQKSTVEPQPKPKFVTVGRFNNQHLLKRRSETVSKLAIIGPKPDSESK